MTYKARTLVCEMNKLLSKFMDIYDYRKLTTQHSIAVKGKNAFPFHSLYMCQVNHIND